MIPVVQTARRAAFPVLLHDGSGLIYSANPETFELGLWWRSMDGTRTQRLTTGLGEYAEPSISRSPDRLVASFVNWNQSLVKFEIDGGTEPQPLFGGAFGDLDASASPDGSRVVFSSTRTGGRTLWMFTTSDNRVRPLTSGAVIDERPAFSSDGTRVAFVSDRGGRRGIWVMNSDGGAAKQVAAVDVLDMVSWSPDGTRLVYAANAGTVPGLFLVTVADGATRQLLTPGPASAPSWCGTRDVIVYIEARAAAPNQANSSKVAAITSAGEAVALDTADLNVLNGFVSCSADGRKLAAFVDPGAAPSAVWISDLDPPRPFRRLSEAPPHVRFRGASWLGGSTSLVAGRTMRSADVVLFERLNSPAPARP